MAGKIVRTPLFLLLSLLTAAVSAVGAQPAEARAHSSLSISSLSPSSGSPGTEVLISGDHFRGTKSVSFNGTSASFRVLSRREVRATVPPEATTGPVSISRRRETAVSPDPFVVVGTDGDLSLHVSDSSDPVVAGTILTYTVVLHNAGPGPANATKIVDSRPPMMYIDTATDH